MDDKNLNPGDRRYRELFDRENQAANIEDQAANGYSRDYSTPTDQSQNFGQANQATSNNGLQSLEQQAVNQGLENTESTQRDIGVQERSAGFDSSSFDGSLKGANTKTKQGKKSLGKFKKYGLVGGIIGLVGGGGLFGLFSIISGPAQVLQAASVIQDFISRPFENMRSARAMRNLMDSVRTGKETLNNRVKNTRVGKIATYMNGSTFKETLAKNGLSFDFSSPHSMKLNLENLTDAEYDRLMRESGLDKSKSKWDKNNIETVEMDGPGGKTTTRISKIELDPRGLTRPQANALIKTYSDPTKSWATNYFQKRMIMKKLGYVSWLHPFKRAEQAAYRKAKNAFELVDLFIKEKIKKPIMAKVKSAKDFMDKNKQVEEELDENGNKVESDISKIDNPDENTWRQRTKNKINVGKAQIKELLDTTFGQLTKKFFKTGNVVLTIIDITCTIRDMNNMSGEFKMANTVNVAMKGSALLIGAASQIKSASLSSAKKSGIGDMTAEQAGAASLTMLGAEIPLAEPGQKIKDPTKAEKRYSSFWQAPVMCSLLQTKDCSLSSDKVPGALLDVKSSMLKRVGGNNFITQGIGSFLNAGATSGVCNLYNGTIGKISGAISKIAEEFGINELQEKIINGITDHIPNVEAVAKVADWITSTLYGKSLDLADAEPMEWGSIAAYGAFYASNSNFVSMGGKKLSNAEASKIRLDNKQQSLRENANKPVLARLFDPTDYGSAINQLARASSIDSSSQNPLTQLANVFKVATKTPILLANASSQLWGGSAYADTEYDYGVSMWGYTEDEQNKLTSTNNGSNEEFGTYKNLDNATCNLAIEEYVLEGAKYDPKHHVVIPGAPYICSQELDSKKSNDGLKVIKSGEIPIMGNPLGKHKLETWEKKLFMPRHYYLDRCMGYDITSVADGAKLDYKDNQDGKAWNYVDMETEDGASDCSEGDANKVTDVRVYVLDYFNTTANACYYNTPKEQPETEEEKKAQEEAEKNKSEDEKKSEQEYKSALDDECGKYGIGGNSSSSNTVATPGNADTNTIQANFKDTVTPTGGKYGGYSIYSNGCTTIPAWFIGEKTTLTYGHGNGSEVARKLVNANPGKGLEVTNYPKGVPAIFSTKSNLMNADPGTYCSDIQDICGHTGLVTEIHEDGSITTIETWQGSAANSADKSVIRHYTKDQVLQSNSDFVYVGDHLK